jgi:hypothetical protein
MTASAWDRPKALAPGFHPMRTSPGAYAAVIVGVGVVGVGVVGVGVVGVVVHPVGVVAVAHHLVSDVQVVGVGVVGVGVVGVGVVGVGVVGVGVVGVGVVGVGVVGVVVPPGVFVPGPPPFPDPWPIPVTMGLPVGFLPAAAAAAATGICSPAPRRRSNCPRTAASTAHASGVAPGMPGPEPDEGVVNAPAEATAADAITGTGAGGTATTVALLGTAVMEDCDAPSLPRRGGPTSLSTRSSNPLSTRIVGAFFTAGVVAGASLLSAVAEARGTVRPLVVDGERFATVPVFAESVRGARLSRER